MRYSCTPPLSSRDRVQPAKLCTTLFWSTRVTPRTFQLDKSNQKGMPSPSSWCGFTGKRRSEFPHYVDPDMCLGVTLRHEGISSHHLIYLLDHRLARSHPSRVEWDLVLSRSWPTKIYIYTNCTVIFNLEDIGYCGIRTRYILFVDPSGLRWEAYIYI